MNDASLQESVESLVARVADEFIERQKQGERPDIEEYAARHSDAAELLRNVLAALDIVGLASSPSHRGTDLQSVLSDEGPHLLGDFRIIREVGRGGMGVVYEAEQVSLGRRVALKVLPFAATLDPRHLQRFKNEAQAAAQLHHTNMVPVYSVGCERGTHFYAMQFIDGVTLASAIADLRLQFANLKKPAGATADGEKPGNDPNATRAYPPPPADADSICNLKSAVCNPTMVALSTERSIKSPAFFRTVAQLGIQAAEALDYAHQVGIVHRDIKPANLMLETSLTTQNSKLETPNSIRLWVTDFGLAHIQHAEGALTMTGDLIGTLRYMSPEQALAKRVIIDHRTDIYSLGATLYELLTLEPVFTGHDRQDLLRQIAFEEPQPPRRLNKDIPAELETIVLKALEKNPVDRYATAQELADDLRRYLMDEPIRARRPRLVQRVRKWARRHKTLTTSLAVLLMTTLFLGAAWAWWHHEEQTGRQRATEISVTAALAQADILLEECNQQHDNPGRMQATGKLALSAVQRAHELLLAGVATKELREQVREVQERVDATMSDNKALTVLDQSMADLADEKPLATDRILAALRDFGVDLSAPEEAAARINASPLRDVLLAALDHAWWGMYQGSPEQHSVEQVIRLTDAASNSQEARWRAALRRRDGKALAKIANERKIPNWMTALNLAGALSAVNEDMAAERLLRPWHERYPGNFFLNHQLGIALHKQKRPEAIRYLTAAVALRSDSAGAHFALGLALAAKGENDEAIRHYKEALKINPTLVDVHHSFGNALVRELDYDGAKVHFETAIKIDPKYVPGYNGLARVLLEKGDLEEAIRTYLHALKLDVKNARTHHNLGNAHLRKGDVDRAIGCFNVALKLDATLDLTHYSLGNALLRNGDVNGAIRSFQAALKIKTALKMNPGLESNIRSNLGTALSDKGDFEQAICEFQAVLKIDPKNSGAKRGLKLAESWLRYVQDLPSILAGKSRPKDPSELVLNQANPEAFSSGDF